MGFSSFFFNGLSENKNKYKKEIFFKNENWKKNVVVGPVCCTRFPPLSNGYFIANLTQKYGT